MNWELVDWIQVDQDNAAFRYLADSIINTGVLKNAEIFWAS